MVNPEEAPGHADIEEIQPEEASVKTESTDHAVDDINSKVNASTKQIRPPDETDGAAIAKNKGLLFFSDFDELKLDEDIILAAMMN